MLSPHELARAYDRSIAALWREDGDGAKAFASWLATFWVTDAPSETAYPDSVSFLGGAGRGIRWYVANGAIVGYVPGYQGGCYRVPVTAALPDVPPARSRAMRGDTRLVLLKPDIAGRPPDCRHAGPGPEGKEFP